MLEPVPTISYYYLTKDVLNQFFLSQCWNSVGQLQEESYE